MTRFAKVILGFAQHGDGATGLRYLFASTCAHEVNDYVEALGQRTVAQQLNCVASTLYQLMGAKAVFINRGTGFKHAFELAQVNDNNLVLEAGVIEPLLRQTAMQRHLTTFKARTDGTAGTGLLTLIALTAGLTQAGAFAVAKALTAVLGAGIGLNRMKL